MGMWDSIKKTTSKITKSIMPNPTEVGEIIAAEQKAEKAVKKTVTKKKAPAKKPAKKK